MPGIGEDAQTNNTQGLPLRSSSTSYLARDLKSDLPASALAFCLGGLVVFCFLDKKSFNIFPVKKFSTCMMHDLYPTHIIMSPPSWKVAATMVIPHYNSYTVLYYCT